MTCVKGHFSEQNYHDLLYRLEQAERVVSLAKESMGLRAALTLGIESVGLHNATVRQLEDAHAALRTALHEYEEGEQ